MSRTAASANGTTSPTRLIGGRRDDLYAGTVTTPSATFRSVILKRQDIGTEQSQASTSLTAIKTGTVLQYPPESTTSPLAATLAITEDKQTEGDKTQQGDDLKKAGSNYVEFPKFETRGGRPEDLTADFWDQWKKSQSIKVE